MAKAFWTLEDGRTFAGRWKGMSYLLNLITIQLKEIKGAEDFYDFLEKFVYREDNADEYNGYGGFIRKDENIMFDFDLRTFAPKNRSFFWLATQNALTRIKIQNGKKNEVLEHLLMTLLDMHKRIKKGEDPMLLNDLSIIVPDPKEKIGPGW